MMKMFASYAGSPPEQLESPLTTRQGQVLAVIQKVIAHTGAPPTREEIAAELGFRSANAAEEHLKALARKGAIELVSGTSRGIRLRAGTSPTSLQRLATLALPLVGRVAAGSPILAQEHIEQTYQLEASLFAQPPHYLLRVSGMSMQGAGIMDGDLLAVRHSQDAVNGQIVVARLGEDVTVKRFYRHPDRIELRAENPDFKPIFVQPGEPFALEGLAVGLIRSSPM